nr:hypothetical protein [Roseovarius sp. W115]
MRIETPPKPDAPTLLTEQGTFSVHGHRLSSLCRLCKQPPNPFIVLKILKKLRSNLAMEIEYFWNCEVGTYA